MQFGISSPKINDVILDHSVITPTYSMPDEVLSTSVFTRKRNWKTYGDYAEFEITVNLHKYNEEKDGISPMDKFSQIYALNHQDVNFMPHKDGKTLKDSTGHEALFHVTQITPYYLNNIINYDMVVIKLESKSYIDLNAALADIALGSEKGEFIVDEHGNKII